MDLGSQYIDPLVNTSRREVLLKMLWSPVKTWPSGLHVNGEHWRFVLEVENIEIKQDLLVVKYFCWYMHGICIQDYRCGLTLIIWWNFRYD
jgi:hypothetical protein